MKPSLKKTLRNVPLLQELFYLYKRVKHRSLKRLGAEAIFTKYHLENFWNDNESVSGSGSNRTNTAILVTELRPMLDKLHISSILDIPCGDFHWMRDVDLQGIHYIGGDVVKGIVDQLSQNYGNSDIEFRHLDLLKGDLPKLDVVMCRDCLVHFSFADIHRALQAIHRSGASYLATTHFPAARKNHDIVTGDWRRLNFTAPPFNWPQPDESIVEDSSEGDGDYADKTLGLWRIDRLPSVSI
jgi:hypothetical protein